MKNKELRGDVGEVLGDGAAEVDEVAIRRVMAEVDQDCFHGAGLEPLASDHHASSPDAASGDNRYVSDSADTGDTDTATKNTPVSDPNSTSGAEHRQPKTAVGTVLSSVADVLPPAKKQKVSPARRRVELQRAANALRGQARTRRAALVGERKKDEPDAARIADLEREIDELDAKLLDLDAEIEQRMERDARRADRDRAIRALDRDPVTGKRRKGPYAYDPHTPEMQTLYADKTTPHLVFADGAKLIRNDGGQYGLAGGILRALLDGAARADESLSPKLRFELVKAACWDALERIHGIGAGYCRDAAWIAFLWSQVTGTPLDLSVLPQRKPLPGFADWVGTEFDGLYAGALTKLGIVETTGSELNAPETTATADTASTEGE